MGGLGRKVRPFKTLGLHNLSALWGSNEGGEAKETEEWFWVSTLCSGAYPIPCWTTVALHTPTALRAFHYSSLQCSVCDSSTYQTSFQEYTTALREKQEVKDQQTKLQSEVDTLEQVATYMTLNVPDERPLEHPLIRAILEEARSRQSRLSQTVREYHTCVFER